MCRRPVSLPTAPSFAALLLCGTLAVLPFVSARGARAQVGRPNPNPDRIPQIPPRGVEVPTADRDELQKGIGQLGADIDALARSLPAAQRDLLPDVQIYYNAVRYALTYNEFFNPREINTAKTLLAQGLERAAQLKAGNAPWTTATGLIVRGYVSKIDGSIQPYGLIVPDDYQAQGSLDTHRLDIWYHGRGETLSELSFINDRQRNRGEFTPAGAFVLHPYGRYCNANRFAGETDTWEALSAVQKHYRINPNEMVTRGFSMGGASCWQFATHYSDKWAAANPGAGFSETAEFLHVFQSDPVKPPWYQQRLWHWYDSVDWAENLFQCPTIAYSGEIDGQRQAAERMNTAMQAQGLTLTHIIGPKAGHFYEANAKKEVARLVDAQAGTGYGAYLKIPLDVPVRFTTWTLRYNTMQWIRVDGLERHWQRARVEAKIADAHTVRIQTQNVTALTLSIPAVPDPTDISSTTLFNGVAVKSGPPRFAHVDANNPLTLIINGQTLHLPAATSKTQNMPRVASTRTVHLHQDGGLPNPWKLGEERDKNKGLHKSHDLQGPIDDAFMDSFVMVTPTGTPLNPKTAAWVQGEQAHAIEHWRRQFRGEARVKTDQAVTNNDIAQSNLVLWGDPGSNKILARILSRLPIKWDARDVRVGTMTYGADHHVPVLIYPNPLNPKHYVVLNSGFTYREYDYLNNARQTAKLPDYAVIDTDVPVTPRAPGGIVRAGFFGERWELLADDGRGPGTGEIAANERK